MSRYRQVIVPTDGEPDNATITVARTVAERLGVPVVLFSIVSAGLEEPDKVELQQIANRIAPDAAARVVIDDGRPTSEQLADVAREPSTLMCLRTQARAAILEAAFGSIGEAVIRASRSGVLVIGPACAPAFSGNRMIIAIEPGSVDESQHQMARELASVLGITPEPVTVVDGSPSPVLKTLSQSPDVAMIAMTTSSKGPLDRVVMGSTTLKLIRQAECPVLVCATHA
jgi:nucleotide-binding universal stress UspA family protein